MDKIEKLIKKTKCDQMVKTEAGWIAYCGHTKSGFRTTLRRALLALKIKVELQKIESNNQKYANTTK